MKNFVVIICAALAAVLIGCQSSPTPKPVTQPPANPPRLLSIDPSVLHVPGIALSGTNVYRDNGTNMTRNGTNYGTGSGGGSATNLTPWTSDINMNGFSGTNGLNITVSGTVTANNFISLSTNTARLSNGVVDVTATATRLTYYDATNRQRSVSFTGVANGDGTASTSNNIVTALGASLATIVPANQTNPTLASLNGMTNSFNAVTNAASADGNVNHFWNGQGGWTTPSGGGGAPAGTVVNTSGAGAAGVPLGLKDSSGTNAQPLYTLGLFLTNTAAWTVSYTNNNHTILDMVATNHLVTFADGATNKFVVTIKTAGPGLPTVTNNSGALFDGQASLQLPVGVWRWESDGVNYHTTLISPITLTTSNTVFAGPVSGSTAPPSMRALVAADIPGNIVSSLQTNVNKAAITNIVGLDGNSANYWGGDGNMHASGSGSVANPTAIIVNNSAINGSASSAIRSDGAPAISTTGVFQFGRLGLGAAADAAIPLTAERDAIGTTPAAGLQITNTTAAAAGAQQDSPSLTLQGNGWGTTAASSQPIVFRMYVAPVQGTVPSALFNLDASVNGGAYVNCFNVGQSGVFNANFSIISNGAVTSGSGSAITMSGRSGISSTADGSLTVRNSAGTGFTILRLGPDAAAPSNVQLRPGDATGTDHPGGNLEIDGGQSTGLGTGGAIVMKTSPTLQATGSTVDTLVPRLYISPKGVSLTMSVATLVFNVSLASGKTAGLHIFATTRADDASNFQATTDDFTIAAINKSGTVTTSATSTSLGTSASSSGTITTTWTAVANGNGVDIKCNEVSTVVVPTTIMTTWRVEIDTNDTGLAVTAQ
jgi:hypothetical protein